MNRPLALLLLWLVGISCVFSQSYTSYNVHGDQAMQKNDYSGARIWYSEGLESCDQYSIRQLTIIWKEHENMRRSMTLTMRRCYNCIKEMAEGQNQEAMMLLSEYYKLGIGVEADPDLSEYWIVEYAASLGLPPVENTSSLDSIIVVPQKTKKSLFSDKFYSFIAYTYSPTMPVGITIGGFGKFGLYITYKTSEYKRSYDFECNNTQVVNTSLITDTSPLYRFDQEDWIGEMITGGILLPIQKEKLYFSLGAGYGKRNYFRRIISEEVILNNNKTAWCYNTEASYKAVAAEIGGLWKWRQLVLAGGVNSTGFKDLDAYVSLGVSF